MSLRKIPEVDLESGGQNEKSAAPFAAKQVPAQRIIESRFSVSSLPTSQSGFSGSLRPGDKEEVNRLLTDSVHFSEAVRSLIPVPYDYSQPSVADFRDQDGIRFGLRALRNPDMDEHFMERLVRRIDDFMTACGIQTPSEGHTRGGFAQALLGYNHGMGAGNQEPYRYRFHKKYEKEIDALLNTKEMQQVLNMATELMDSYFPGVAALCRELDAFWYENGSENPLMDFCLFYNMAINVDMGKRVKSIPHRDVMNLAWGVCAIFVFGFFPDGDLAWLVNLEAGVVIQIPSAVFYLCLSSVITHFNVDRHEFWAGESALDFVVTEHWEMPTAFNTRPLHSIRSGRGSIVLYNQGSAFRWKLTGEKAMEGAVSKYGGMDKLGEAMAVVARNCLDRRDN